MIQNLSNFSTGNMWSPFIRTELLPFYMVTTTSTSVWGYPQSLSPSFFLSWCLPFLLVSCHVAIFNMVWTLDIVIMIVIRILLSIALCYFRKKQCPSGPVRLAWPSTWLSELTSGMWQALSFFHCPCNISVSVLTSGHLPGLRQSHFEVDPKLTDGWAARGGRSKNCNIVFGYDDGQSWFC